MPKSKAQAQPPNVVPTTELDPTKPSSETVAEVHLIETPTAMRTFGPGLDARTAEVVNVDEEEVVPRGPTTPNIPTTNPYELVRDRFLDNLRNPNEMIISHVIDTAENAPSPKSRTPSASCLTGCTSGVTYKRRCAKKYR